MSVKIQFNEAAFASRIKSDCERAEKAVAENILQDSRPWTPHAEGHLENSGRVEMRDGHASAVWDTEYAAYQYYGCWPDKTHQIKKHNTKTNANASTLWVEKARAVHEKNWEQVAQNAATKLKG